MEKARKNLAVEEPLPATSEACATLRPAPGAGPADLPERRLYGPALVIMAAVVLLLILISASTLRHIDHQKDRTAQYLEELALTLARALEAGARTGMALPRWNEEAMAALLAEVGRDPRVAHIYLYDRHGRLTYHSDPSLEGSPVPWAPALKDPATVVTRVNSTAEGARVFEMARWFMPLRLVRQGDLAGVRVAPDVHRPNAQTDSVLVIGLHLAPYDLARREDLQHALLMGAIVLLLGAGLLFFFYVIRSYHTVGRALRLSIDTNRQILASMANGLISIDTDGRITACNQPAAELLGLDAAAVLGKDLAPILDFEATGIAGTLRQGSATFDREIDLPSPTQTPLPVALSVTPIRGAQAQGAGAVIVLRDLREIKHLEKRLRRTERLAAVGELAAGVAHEIRNPLSSIRGFARFLGDAQAAASREREAAQLVVREVDRINRVVSDLLTFARPVHCRRRPVVLAGILEHVQHLVADDARSHNANLHLEVTPPDTVFEVDEQLIIQALLNLTLNAVQALGREGGQVWLAAAVAEGGRNLTLEVTDDGPGIPAGQQSQVFNPYFTTRGEGTGLGLPISHKLVESHGGTLRLESPPPGRPRGCRFTLQIPAEKREELT